MAVEIKSVIISPTNTTVGQLVTVKVSAEDNAYLYTVDGHKLLDKNGVAICIKEVENE